MVDAGFAVEKMGELYSLGYIEGVERVTKFQDEYNSSTDPVVRASIANEFKRELDRLKENPMAFGWENLYPEETSHDGIQDEGEEG